MNSSLDPEWNEDFHFQVDLVNGSKCEQVCLALLSARKHLYPCAPMLPFVPRKHPALTPLLWMLRSVRLRGRNLISR